jgi:proline dehydrogenase
MNSEKARAALLGIKDPINPTIDSTHEMYNQAISYLAENQDCSFIVASHNRDSINHAIRSTNGTPGSTSRMAFASLLGMQDATTQLLVREGYASFKYIPYGPLEVTIPYLVRRAQGNSALMAAPSSKDDQKDLKDEILYRLGLLYPGVAIV